MGAAPGDPSRDQVLARQGETIARGHGTFTTSAGEVQYRYTCPSKVVMGVDTPKCYHAMPVALEEEDLAAYAEFAGLTTEQAANVTFFVEPYTRVLTTTAAEAPCVPGLSPMYEALDGSWVQATPTLQKMTGPQAINSSEFLNYYYNGSSYYPVPNFAQSGIYRTETLQKFQMYRQGPRYEAAAISSIRDAWLGASHPSGEDTSGGARSFFGAYQMVGDANFEDVLSNCGTPGARGKRCASPDLSLIHI